MVITAAAIQIKHSRLRLLIGKYTNRAHQFDRKANLSDCLKFCKMQCIYRIIRM